MSENINYLNVLRRNVLSYDEFYADYLLPNVPVIFNRSLVSSWPAFDLWVKSCKDSNSSHIHWDYFQDTYGALEVTVADCANVDSFGNQDRRTMLLREVISMWKDAEGQSLYIKDWHLAKQLEKTGSPSVPFYSTPDFFRDDWMNSYYTSHTDDDFRFVYMGAKGTFTPLHRDVYTSYSWSTNVYGRKRWWFFPPEQTPYLFMKYRNVNLYDVRNVDLKDFPDFHRATPIIIEQEAGETIFVPSGWYHQVENLTHCISINHNWCNSVNLRSLYTSMCAEVIQVEAALEDVREILSKGQSDDEWKLEWTRIVQDVVNRDAGWNWLTFWKMVSHALHAVVSPGSSSPQGVSSRHNVFPPAPANLRPPTAFILEQIRACYDDFMTRDRRECEGEVQEVVSTIGSLLVNPGYQPLKGFAMTRCENGDTKSSCPGSHQ